MLNWRLWKLLRIYEELWIHLKILKVEIGILNCEANKYCGKIWNGSPVTELNDPDKKMMRIERK